jgi:2-dehydropantoate 2-reductase
MTSDSWPKIAVVGAGAVGGYFGGMLARARAVDSDRSTRICRRCRKERTLLDTVQFQEHLRVDASTDLAAAVV